MSKKTKLRSDTIRSKPGHVDRDKNVIEGFSVISLGGARGHGLEIDETTLDQVIEFGNKHRNGIKMRFGHPTMSTNAEGRFLGRARKFRKNEDETRVLADAHLDKTAMEKSPNSGGKPVGVYVMDLADSDSDAFGSSIVFALNAEYRIEEDGTRKKDSDGNELMPLARVEELYATDIVDDPATGDGLFSSDLFSDSVNLSAETTNFLNKYLSADDALEKVEGFFEKYLQNEEYKSLKEKIIRAINLKQETDNKITFTLNKEADIMPKDKEKTDAGQEKKVSGISEAAALEREELAVNQERDRQKAIRLSGEKLGVSEKIIDELVENGTALEKANVKLIDECQKAQKSATGGVIPGTDEVDKNRELFANSMLVRMGIEKDPAVIAGVRKSNYNGLSFHSLARVCLHNDGFNTIQFGGNQLWNMLSQKGYLISFGASQGSGDFVNVLSNVLRKAMGKEWALATTTFEIWTGTGSLQDFKTHDIPRLTEYGDVDEIQEGMASKQVIMTDTKEQTRLQTWGAKASLTRQSFVNDDMNALVNQPQKLIRSLRRKMNLLCYQLMYDGNGANSAFNGVTHLEDGVVTFHAASHDNFDDTAAAPTKTTLDTAYVAFLKRTALAPDAKAANIYLNLIPKYILLPAKYQLAAYDLFNSLGYSVSGESNASIHKAGQPRHLQMVIDATLDNIDDTYWPWYLAGDPNEVDTVKLWTLDGNTVPYQDSAPDPVGGARGIVWDMQHDYRFSIPDWRGLHCTRGVAK